jgi:hypothetical protein
MSEPHMHEQQSPAEAELVEFVRGIDVAAPDSLHRSVQAMIDSRAGSARAGRPRARARGPRLAAGAALACGAVAVALAIGLGSGGSQGLSLSDTAALTLRPASVSAPAESAHSATELAAAVQGVSFPYWEEDLGWRSTGKRSDTVAGHAVTTVFYADRAGARVGYAIVSGSAPKVNGGTLWWRRGIPYRVQSVNGVEVVSWLRSGHLCVVSGRGVEPRTLLALASWDERAARA